VHHKDPKKISKDPRSTKIHDPRNIFTIKPSNLTNQIHTTTTTMAPKVIVITTNISELAGKPNGTYFPELTHAVDALSAQGIEFDIASPNGGKIPGYGADADDVTKKLLADEAFSAVISNTMKLDDVDPSKYDAVFYPGGYGLLFDLTENETAHKITRAIYEAGKPISAVCHGPAALALIKLSDGTGLIDGKDVTGFTREEEVAMDTLSAIPFVLEERMIENGGVYRKKKAWQPLVVEDGLLITGQNPQSAGPVGKALAARLAK
jgi:putative intracellular protease/amidase